MRIESCLALHISNMAVSQRLLGISVLIYAYVGAKIVYNGYATFELKQSSSFYMNEEQTDRLTQLNFYLYRLYVWSFAFYYYHFSHILV